MVNTTGTYRSAARPDVVLVGDTQTSRVFPEKTSTTSDATSIKASLLRRHREGWLSIDDGLLGRHGDPQQLHVELEGESVRVWVEQRGREQFGLIPWTEQGYSNTFLALDTQSASAQGSDVPRLVVVEEWKESAVWTVQAVQ